MIYWGLMKRNDHLCKKLNIIYNIITCNPEPWEKIQDSKCLLSCAQWGKTSFPVQWNSFFAVHIECQGKCKLRKKNKTHIHMHTNKHNKSTTVAEVEIQTMYIEI